jgi:hypothetical protein
MTEEKMTPYQIAKELYDSYRINSGTPHWDAKQFATKTLHIMALVNNMSYKEFYEIAKEIEAL